MVERGSLNQAQVTHVAGPIYELQLPGELRPDMLVRPKAVQFVDPNGRVLKLSAFRGEDRWRARVAAHRPGEWRWSLPGGGESGAFVVSDGLEARWPGGALRLSGDRRYLTHADGSPFFYFADTAWFIIWKGTPDQWERYLDLRAEQGFTVVQTQLLPFHWDLTDVEGNYPFVDQDPARPNEAYFRRAERFLTMAAERGLHVFLATMWGAVQPHHVATHFTSEQGANFARYAVSRLGSYPLLWSLAGDDDYTREVGRWETMGQAVDALDPYGHPTTNHLPPRLNWHFLFHASPWHDFHMLQTGHRRSAIADVADLPLAYYRREPAKAVVNGEPWYEAHPDRDTREYGPVFTPYEARFAFWVSVLSGATMGHTYGSQGIWNWKREGDGDEPLGGPGVGPIWSEAMRHDGAKHCAIGARLLQSLPWWQLVPSPERAELSPPPTAERRPACAVVPGKLWVVYLPVARGALALKGLEPGSWQARWLDPRTGEESEVGAVEPGPDRKWRVPSAPSMEDWVLVLSAKG